MSLEYILRRVESKSGLSASNSAQRARLLDVINEAARELYKSRDLPNCLQECYVRVTADSEIALPQFVDEIRAIRSTEWNDIWTLRDMRPRYNSVDWPNKWRSWRIKGYSPIAVTHTNAAPGTIEIEQANSECVVSLVGETESSNKIAEEVTLSATTQPWTINFTGFKTIKKNIVTDHDVTIKDADGTELAILYSDQLESKYLIVDVSAYPDLQTCQDGSSVMEVLFKPKLPRLENDTDSFPVFGFDDVLVLKTMQLLMEDEEGKEQKAILAFNKAEHLINRITEDKNGTVEKQIKFVPNKKFGIFNRRYW